MPESLRRLSRSRRLAHATAAVIVGLVLAAATEIWMLRQGAIADTADDNHRLGVVIAEQTARTLQAADSVLQQVSEKIASSGVNDLRSLHETFGGMDYHEALAKRLIDLPQVGTFVIFDATGHFVNDAKLWPMPNYSNINRPYIQHFLSDPDPQPYFQILW